MIKEEAGKLAEKIKNGSATEKEKLAALKDLNSSMKKLNGLVGALSEEMKKEAE